MKSMKPRKQRKAFYNAPLHKRHKNISAHLEENLLLKYDRRNIPLITGDTVRVMRGAFKGHEDKVAKIHVKDYRVEIEGVTITKADGKKIAKPIHPSNLLITKLNLTDKWRRNNLEKRVSEDTRKEIEEEAKQQIKAIEEEKKRQEEEQIAAEKEAEEEAPSEDESIKEEPEKETKQQKDTAKEKPTTTIKKKTSPSSKTQKSSPQTKKLKETKEKKEKEKEDKQ